MTAIRSVPGRLLMAGSRSSACDTADCFHCKAETLLGVHRTQNIETVLRPSTVKANEPNRCTLVVPKAKA